MSDSLLPPVDGVTVEKALLDAAAQSDAFYPQQLLPFLRPFTSINSDGQAVVRVEDYDLSPSEAIRWMKDQPHKYRNLFKDGI